MKRSEIADLIGVVQEIWPSFLTGRNIARTTDIWYKLFDSETSDEVLCSIEAYACRDTKGFPPPIGAIKELVWQQRNERISEQIAWEMVRKQLNGSSAHPRENFEKLPELVRQCVGTPQTLMRWGQMDDDDLETVVASNFKRTFRETVTKKREHDVLPISLQPKFAEKQMALPDVKPEAQNLLEAKEWNGTPCPPEIRARIQAIFNGDKQEERHASVCD